MIEQARLCRPADIHRARDVRARPSEDIRYLIPVRHLLEFQLFHRCTRDDHTIKLLVAHLLEVAIEHHHVLYRRILRCVTAEFHKTHLQLQRRIG